MNKRISNRESVLFKGGICSPVDESLVIERPLQIIVNGREFSMTMQTPGDEKYLVRGMLHSEGIDRSEFIVFGLEEDGPSTIAIVEIHCDEVLQTKRSMASVSSCGLCGKQSVDRLMVGLAAVDRSVEISHTVLADVFKKIDDFETVFSKTGGCHIASAARADGEVLCLFEDIGRHNAVDKVVGWLLESDRLDEAALLTVSGRISFEIVQKCIRAGIPVLAAISAPSSMAVEMAEEYGLTVAAFCRGNRATVYAHSGRILEQEKREVNHV